MEMSALEGPHEFGQIIVFLAIFSVVRDVLYEKVVADQMWKAAMRAVMFCLMLKSKSGALLKHDDFMAVLFMLVSNHIEKESNLLKKKEENYKSKLKKQEVLPLPSTSVPEGGDNIPSREEKK